MLKLILADVKRYLETTNTPTAKMPTAQRRGFESSDGAASKAPPAIMWGCAGECSL